MKAERTRATTSRRGYGARHQRIRRALQPLVAAGLVTCARCGLRIHPGESWDLGHDDLNRALHRGAEHQRCNRATNTGRVQSREW